MHVKNVDAGGMLALGVYWMGSEHPNATRDMQLAINFTNTCYESYLRSVPKLGRIFHSIITIEQ